MCKNCGGTLTPTGMCADCGIIHRKFDFSTLLIGILGIALHPALAFVANLMISSLNFGTTAISIITVISYLIPLSISCDALFLAIKRRKAFTTWPAFIFGILGVAIGIVFFLQWLLS